MLRASSRCGALSRRHHRRHPGCPRSRSRCTRRPIFTRRVTISEVSRDDWERDDGLSFMRKYLDGTFTMPFSGLYGMRFVDVDKGRAVTSFPALEWFGRHNMRSPLA